MPRNSRKKKKQRTVALADLMQRMDLEPLTDEEEIQPTTPTLYTPPSYPIADGVVDASSADRGGSAITQPDKITATTEKNSQQSAFNTKISNITLAPAIDCKSASKIETPKLIASINKDSATADPSPRRDETQTATTPAPTKRPLKRAHDRSRSLSPMMKKPFFEALSNAVKTAVVEAFAQVTALQPNKTAEAATETEQSLPPLNTGTSQFANRGFCDTAINASAAPKISSHASAQTAPRDTHATPLTASHTTSCASAVSTPQHDASSAPRSDSNTRTSSRYDNRDTTNNRYYQRPSRLSPRLYRAFDKRDFTVNPCRFCDGRHRNAECDEFTSPAARRVAIAAKSACATCLVVGHSAAECRGTIGRCDLCAEPHHYLLCDNPQRHRRFN